MGSLARKILLFWVNSVLESLLSTLTNTQNANEEDTKQLSSGSTNHNNHFLVIFAGVELKPWKSWANFLKKFQSMSILVIHCNRWQEALSMPKYGLQQQNWTIFGIQFMQKKVVAFKKRIASSVSQQHYRAVSVLIDCAYLRSSGMEWHIWHHICMACQTMTKWISSNVIHISLQQSRNGKVNSNNTKMGRSVDSSQATRFEAVPKQMAGLEIAPRVLCICSW